jgi:steroid delta-isomerase-like uncharacterized protein
MTNVPTDELLESFREHTNAAWNRGDHDAFDDVCADDVVVHDVPMGETYEGLDAFKRWVGDIRQGFPDFRLDDEATTFFVADGRIVSQWVFHGTHDGRLPGIDADPTNQSVEMSGATVYGLEDGVVTEAWWYYDMLGMLAQLGLVPGELPA